MGTPFDQDVSERVWLEFIGLEFRGDAMARPSAEKRRLLGAVEGNVRQGPINAGLDMLWVY